MEALSHTYSANVVNQYILENIAGVVPVVGEADPAAEVTAIQGEDSVNYPPQFGMKPERDGKYFTGSFAVDNSVEDTEYTYKVYAVKADAENADRYLATKKEGSYTVPQALQPFTYDADGNTLSWRGWTYTWDAENRLKSVSKGDLLLEFTYDFSSRRISKKVTRAEVVESHTTFIYDGYKLVEERDALNSNALLRRYHWNLVFDTPATVYDAGLNATYYYLTDANKNILALQDASGNRVATYDYSPFGEQLEASGDYASLNPFRFSSEYFDTETGLVYYNYRYYNPATGRWLSREPLEEEGSLNLYSMVNNNPVKYWDNLGLEIMIDDLPLSGTFMVSYRTGWPWNDEQLLGWVHYNPDDELSRDEAYYRASELRLDQKTCNPVNQWNAWADNMYEASPIPNFRGYYNLFEEEYGFWGALLGASAIALNPTKGLGESIFGESLDYGDRGRPLSKTERIVRGSFSAVELIGSGIGANATLNRASAFTGRLLNPQKVSNATGIGGKTEVVERWMSRAELEATQQTGLLRGGRAGKHYVTDCANVDALRARQRLALDHTPEVRVQLEVPKGVFPPGTKVEPLNSMPGGGMERMVEGIDVPVRVLKVYD